MEKLYYYFTSLAAERRYRCTTHFKLMMPIHGTVTLITAGGRRTVSDSEMCLLPFREMYAASSQVSNESLVIAIPEEDAAFYFKDVPDKRESLHWPIDAAWRPIKELVLAEAANGNKEDVALLLNYVLRKIADQPVSASIRFINKHYTERIGIQSLAAMEHYTPSYYCGWFKKKMNMTPIEYIHFLRIRRAKELLRDSELSVLAISYQVGYEYNASFTKMFKKYEQLSPYEYRAESGR
ncbi:MULTISPECIES: helix-turn-helix transcriptional regulator [unclassified Sporolactobacillus]|uniref:helix-turn-helix transcriptional regulator n=1 Tax=unclassified Sporolactobacillus TaxID=2628533 RepID=UPI002368993A|nr:AraC family transcriptional regulator [Sporolactobacillus sp. CQH2019]MDD9147460.1 AraC family transcriptional regulator [Sporolactobacillus sp. CQH2019]